MNRRTVQLRRLAEVNPTTPEFDAVPDDSEIAFVPLEAVWPSGRGDLTRRARKETVASGYTRFQSGDVLVPKITPTFEAARVMVANTPTRVGAATTEVHVVRAGTAADSRFIAYTLQSAPFIQEGTTTLQGVGNLRRVPPEFLKEYRVADLCLESQRAIADFLDRETAQIDAMVDAQERLVALLEERRNAGWSRYFDELVQASPSLPVRRIIASIVDGPFGSSLTSAHYSDSGTRVIRLGNIGINEFKDADKAYIPDDYARELDSHSAAPGDVVIAGLGDERMPLGRAAVVPDIGPAIVKADCYRVRPNDQVTANYLAWAMSAPPTREQIALLARGSTRQRLNTTIVREVTIPVPSLSEQRRVVAAHQEHAAKTGSMIAKARESIALMKERRAAVISAAVTGRIDVRTGIEQVERDLEEARA